MSAQDYQALFSFGMGLVVGVFIGWRLLEYSIKQRIMENGYWPYNKNENIRIEGKIVEKVWPETK